MKNEGMGISEREQVIQRKEGFPERMLSVEGQLEVVLVKKLMVT